MLEPLDLRKLRALESDEEQVDCYSIRSAKRFFARNEVLESVRNLLQAFRIRPHLYQDHSNPEQWHLQFPDPLFDTLYLRAKGTSVEIYKHRSYVLSKEVQDVFKRKEKCASIEMVGRPQNWVLMLQWLWAHGNEVYIANVKNGTMLRPLDDRKLSMLERADNEADDDSIRRTKASLGKEKDLAGGIICLFEGWDIFVPVMHRGKEMESIWHVTFRNSPFRSLRIQPGADHGIVDIYTFDKYNLSFQVLNNPKTPDWDSWQRLLLFVHDYGKRRQELKKQWEESHFSSPKEHIKSQSRSTPTEKPLLHKVLRTASFKSQRAAIPRAKNKREPTDTEDDVMEEIDDNVHAEKFSSHQLSNQKSILCAADGNARMDTSWMAKDKDDSQTTKAEADDVNIGGLEILDYQP